MEEELKEKLGRGIPKDVNERWLHQIRVEEGYIFVPNKIAAGMIKERYRTNLNGYDIVVDASLGQQETLNMEPKLDYAKMKRDSLIERCLPYSYIGGRENCFCKDPSVIIHGGNRGLYNYFGTLLHAAKDERKGSFSIVYGGNGYGKTFALNTFAYMLRQDKTSVVAFRVNDLTYHLTPGNHPKVNGEIVEPEYYTLAKKVAKVVLVDQTQDLMRRNGSKKDHRPGTQKWILNLTNAIKGRNAHVVFFVTESPGFGLEDLISNLEDDITEDSYGNVGYRDLGSRLDSYPKIKIGNIPMDSKEEFIRRMVKRNYVLMNSGISINEFIAGFMAVGYGRDLTPRQIVSNIKTIELQVEHGERVSAESIVRSVGKKKAKDRLAEDGFDFGVNGDREGLKALVDKYASRNANQLSLL